VRTTSAPYCHHPPSTFLVNRPTYKSEYLMTTNKDLREKLKANLRAEHEQAIADLNLRHAQLQAANEAARKDKDNPNLQGDSK